MAGTTRGRYVGSLDGLRALCALAVVGYHMRLSWLGGGLLGVTVLFVLSGYLVTAGLMREFSATRGTVDLAGFWRRRAWRLMPTVVVFVAITGAVCAVFDHALFTKMRGDILPALLMVINWTKIVANESYFAAAGAPSPLTHFWSLAIEAQFYVLWPPVFYLLMRRGAKRRAVRVGLLVATAVSAVLMAVLYVPGADPTRAYYGTDTRAMSLLLGCWLAVAWPFDRMSRSSAASLAGARRMVAQVAGPVGVAGVVAMMVLTEGYSSFSYYGGFLLCSVLAAAAIAGLVPEGTPLGRALGVRPLTWVGERSYAIYLWHYPILELLNPLSATSGVPWWKLVLELALILGVSELSYRFVEQPLRKGLAGIADAGDKGAAGAAGGVAGALGRLRTSPATLAVACVTVLATVATVVGLLTVRPVTVAGDDVDDKRVMHASLRKPLQDGVYDVVLVGDSVSLGANEQLNEAFPHGMIDTRGEREAPEALEVLSDYLKSGVVGGDVVLSIGTNGVLSSEQLEAFVDAVGERTLWLVNLRSPNAKDVDNNALIDECVEAHDNVRLIDWYGASEGHDEWLIEDGIHLTWDGRDAYARLVVDTMGYEVPNESNTTYDVVVLGDVVCLGAADELSVAYPHGLVDTAEGRSVAEVERALASYVEQGVVGTTVVIAVGGEDPLDSSEVEALVSAAGEGRDVWLVTVRVPGTWSDGNNRVLASVARAHDNVELVDWNEASAGHDDWFDEDGLGLSDAGATAFARLVFSTVTVRDTGATSLGESSGSEEGEEMAVESSAGDTAESYDETYADSYDGTYDDAYAADGPSESSDAYVEGSDESYDSGSYDYAESTDASDYGYESSDGVESYDYDYSYDDAYDSGSYDAEGYDG